ncbi:MAG TPA: cation diffusion facilitator family transporter [Methanomicrobiales archaeon]|nr:cation diffusion facilitator family transporter [Methanomicrobiales archaeon]
MTPDIVSTSEGNIRVAFFLNLVFTVAEFAGGILFSSLAISADALHDLGDSFSLGLAWFFERLAGRKPSPFFSYGYRRFSLVAAFLNGVVLLAGGAVILWSAVPRLLSPVRPDAPGMFVFAIVGIVVNGAAALRLRKGHTLNEQTVAWHLVEDLLGWAAILAVSLALMIWDVPVLDPAVSILITLVVLVNVVRNLRRTVVIFLQGVPPSLSLEAVGDRLGRLPGVAGVHDLHLWSLDGEHHILTAHVIIPEETTGEESMAIKCRVKDAAMALGIQHATIEVEHPGESCRMREVCTVEPCPPSGGNRDGGSMEKD